MTTFEQIFGDLIDRLTNDGILLNLLSNFGTIEDTNKKSEFADEIVKKYLRRPEIQLRETKCNKKSTRLRTLGNNHFNTGDFLMALKLYNESICYAQKDSEEISLAFANRSAVYFELELHDDCLKNIELAKKAAYPARLMDKLNKRLSLSMEQRTIKKSKYPLIEPELSFPSNSQVPFIANCLQLQKNAQYGRPYRILRLVTLSQLKNHFVHLYPRNFNT